MRIFAGPAPGSPVNIDRWRPDDSLADQDGLVRAEFLWAALDCPGAFALRFGGDNALLLGRLTGEVRRRPNVGEALKAAAWRVGQEGRKHFSSSAIFDRAGEIVAGANAVWIELADTAMVDRLRRENA